MNRIPFEAALAAVLCCVAAPLAIAATPEETRLLGSDREEAQFQSYMPFTRTLAASGIVAGSLAASAASAGVPAAALVEALAALGAGIDLERELRDGDRFYVRYERSFTAAGDSIGIGKVMWAELRTEAKGTVSIHRFRTGKPVVERFWLASGRAAAPPEIRFPLETVAVSSGFGLRADPFDQPPRGAAPKAPAKKGAGGPPPSPLTAVNVPTALGLSLGLAPSGARPSAGGGARGTTLMMHHGVDLAAEMGTPIRAAGDGVVTGAELKGGYGNWIEIEHDSAPASPFQGFRQHTRLTTVYGHLSAFADGIAPGARVNQGEVIGYVGSTGRSTGPHLHFEIQHNGKPTNPMINPATRPDQLRGGELERFRKAMARDLQERQREAGSI